MTKQDHSSILFPLNTFEGMMFSVVFTLGVASVVLFLNGFVVWFAFLAFIALGLVIFTLLDAQRYMTSWTWRDHQKWMRAHFWTYFKK
jgi:hypothetical protein